MTIYFNTLKYHNNLQHPRAFLPLCFVGVGGRCCSDILFSGPRVRGPLGSFKLQLFHKQLLSVRSLSGWWHMRHWVIVWNCGCGLNSKDRCSGEMLKPLHEWKHISFWALCLILTTSFGNIIPVMPSVSHLIHYLILFEFLRLLRRRCDFLLPQKKMW